MVLPLEKDYVPRYSTVHPTGIVRSKERVLQSGGCAPSTRIVPFHQGFSAHEFIMGVVDEACL